MKESMTFFLAWTATYVLVALVWNVITYFYRGPETTISTAMEWLGRNHPIIPIALVAGVAFLSAHWWWPVQVHKDKPGEPPATLSGR